MKASTTPNIVFYAQIKIRFQPLWFKKLEGNYENPMDDDVSLPKSTIQKLIKDLMPDGVRIAADATDMVARCANEFVHLVTTQANEISEREKKSTITPDHIIKALDELEFKAFLEAANAGEPRFPF
jgi:histone H3/H4